MEENNIYIAGKGSLKTIYDRIHLIITKTFSIRYNTIKNCIEISKKHNNNHWEIINSSSLYIFLKQNNIQLKKTDLDIFLSSYFVSRYDPIKSYIENLPPWDKQDHIAKLCSYLETEDNNEFLIQFRKWLVRAIRCVLENGYFNKNCFVLVSGEESTGKTSFCKFLIPPAMKDYSTDTIDSSKDGIITQSSNWMTLLDEIDLMPLKDLKFMKSAISRTTVTIRPPYGHRVISVPRISSYLATTNSYSFLNTDIGNIRWICFEIMGIIDFSYSNDIDIEKVWSQALHLSKQKGFDCELTSSEIKKNKLRNEKYKLNSWYEDIINQHYEKSSDKNDFSTAGNIVESHRKDNAKANNVSMGKALNSLGFEKIKQNGVYGYCIKRKSSEERNN
ncbi:VapE domain-containing protein [Nonlabens sp. Asnod3-A02]|uniref:VapE domain-containing protein n=1 Tax=Nonlabens sp. Asnod3-A02 TaxID=3160579 RepID=UPI00386A450F